MTSETAKLNRWMLPLALLAFAVCVRGGVLVAGWSRLGDDPDGYRRLALNLVKEGTFGFGVVRDGSFQVVPTAYRPPLYPLVLAMIGFADGADSATVALLHLALGAATVLVMYALAVQRFGSGVATVAAVLVTVDPILLNQSALVMTETLATFLATTAWLVLSRDELVRRPLTGWMAGLVLGLAALCRPTFLVWLVLVAVVLLTQAARERRWLSVLAFCLAPAIVLAPWVARNEHVFHRPIVATTHGGYTLWLGNNDDFYEFLRTAPWGSVWSSAALDERYNRIKDSVGGDEIAADRWARQQAMQCIQRQPGTFVYACLVRVGRLWGLMPHRLTADESPAGRMARFAVGGWYLVVFLIAAFGLICLGWRLFESPWRWGLLLCASFTAVHSVYWSNLRMRAPLMPVVYLAAAWAIVLIVQRWRTAS